MKNNYSHHFFISVPSNFNFWRTVYSHGWCVLKPYSIDKKAQTFNRLFELESGKLVFVRIKAATPTKIKVTYEVKSGLTPVEKKNLTQKIKYILRVDDNFAEFYSVAKKKKDFLWVNKLKAGRMLRSPSVFEDLIKLICTTNCSWSLTEIMINNLTGKLGERFLTVDAEGNNLEVFSFPDPKTVASFDEKFMRQEIRAGYRSPYIIELAKKVAGGAIDLDSFKNSDLPTKDLFKKVTAIKGVGPYAAGNMLKLLGRYDYLGIDSWCRTKFSEIYKYGIKISDKTIEKRYKQFGKFRGLFFWMDVTRDWYRQKFPF
jgi:3-methyladenine DNA glycosylase/8-oxoguanine DNA glycosylase